LQERLSSEEVTHLSDVRNLVNQLYEALNVREHQIRKERELRSQLEKLNVQLQPLEEV
jgi:calcium uniporter protein, mitochondrial